MEDKLLAEMANHFCSSRDLHFHLYEVLAVERLTQFPNFTDHDRESFSMVLDTVAG